MRNADADEGKSAALEAHVAAAAGELVGVPDESMDGGRAEADQAPSADKWLLTGPTIQN